MRNRSLIVLSVFILIGSLSFAFALTDSSFNNNNFLGSQNSLSGANYQSSASFNTYYSSSQTNSYWPILENMKNGSCVAGSDFIVMIPPAGCSPAVVRSDLLEDQRVPVFCQLSAIQLNPLIKVSSIKSISFSGKKPAGVVDIDFHPARAAIRTYNTLLGSPVLNNIGYVVIILEKNAVEKNMADWIFGNLTATIYYDIDKAFGTGQSEYFLPIMTDENWTTNFKNYGFWSGKGYLRAESISNGQAEIGLYTDKDVKFNEVNLKEGQVSSSVYFPGSYCKANLNVKLNGIETEQAQARLSVDGNTIWVREKSQILDGRCTIKNLKIQEDKTGSLDVYCSNQKTVTLSLLPKGARLSVDSIEKVVNVGEIIKGNKSLAYSGFVPEIIGNVDQNTQFIVVYNGDGNNKISILDLEKSISSKVYEISQRRDIFNFAGFNASIISLNKDLTVIKTGDSGDISIIGVVDSSSDVNYNSQINGQVMEDYFSQLDKNTQFLVNDYSQVSDDNVNFAEEALWQEVIMAEKIGKQETMIRLSNDFIQKYPASNHIWDIKNRIQKSSLYNTQFSYLRSLINNDYHDISLEELKPVDLDSKRIVLSIGGFGDQNLREKQKYELTASTDLKVRENAPFVYVDKVEQDKATILYHYLDINKARHDETIILKLDETNIKSGRAFTLKDIELKRVARVSLNPNIKNTKTEANFTFKIGIEKRAIQLSDEKTREMIKNINKSIETWESVNTKLGNLIKVWKGACFATSLVLMGKNAIAGFSGESLARQKVMDAYRQKCKEEESTTGRTLSQCYSSYASQIDSDVNIMKGSINKANEDIIKWNSECKSSTQSGILDGDIINSDCVKKKMQDALRAKGITNVKIGENKFVDVSNINNYDTLKLLLAEQDKKLNGITQAYNNIKAEQLLTPVYLEQEEAKAIALVKKQLEGAAAPIGTVIDVASLDTAPKDLRVWGGNKLSDFNNNIQTAVATPGIDLATPVQVVKANEEKYLLVLNQDTGTSMTAKSVYKFDSNGQSVIIVSPADKIDAGKLTGTTSEITAAQLKSSYGFVTGGECAYGYKSPRVRYYDTEPYKGMPGIVPLDVKNGWYAKISQSTGTLSTQQKSYTAAGQINFFYLCNVGKDGVESNGEGDSCLGIDVNNYKTIESFPGCPSVRQTKIQTLIENAQRVIKQAAEQYSSSGDVKLSSSSDSFSVKRDTPMGGTEQTQCQDFMSPSDCKVLFNVCDPVICPASRCNLGGKYPVSDVIQTGIIGSIFLCLPNIKEGVIFPICISGIHAGIESFVSILRSERDCLTTSLNTGEHVGICDEITSVYMCEFFWRQLSPIMNMVIPKLVESAYGQGSRGGGEYLSVTNSWNTLQKNIDYFKNTYAQNAFRAFQVKNVEEAGGTFCKAFVGTSLPTSASALDNLLEPESPNQIYAWFSEISYSEATVPSTSQYKVYFHIYAGKDTGTQFSVYLKNPPDSGYYKNSEFITVKTGYIAVGDSADETIDFTAPSGYKELCVDVNGKSNCGFKSVTTDFALDYLSKKYTEDVASQNVSTEKECISGKASVYSLVTPNMQSGVEQTINPTANLNGVVRICATDNPNKVVTPSSDSPTASTVLAAGAQSGSQKVEVNFKERWQEVGYCDSTSIRCWLDTNSVKADIKTVRAIDNLSLVDAEKQLDLLNNPQKITDTDTKSVLDAIKNAIEDQSFSGIQGILKTRLNDLTSPTEANIRATIKGVIGSNESALTELGGSPGVNGQSAKATSNVLTANALLLKSKLYGVVLDVLKKEYFNNVKENNVAATGLGTTTPTAPTPDVSATNNAAVNTRVEGFYLVGDYIIYSDGTREQDTGLRIEAKGSGYLIYYQTPTSIGSILNKKISFNNPNTDFKDSKDLILWAGELKNSYRFDGKNFTKISTSATA